MKTVAKIYLASVLLVFWGFTVVAWARPHWLAGHLGITLTNLTAIADFRAMYGGMCLGVGVLFWLGITRPTWRMAALLLSVTTAGGLLLARILTWAVEGDPGPVIYGFMATEIGAVGIGSWLMTKPRAMD